MVMRQTITAALVAAVAADIKVFRADRCNTNAEVSRTEMLEVRKT